MGRRPKVYKFGRDYFAAYNANDAIEEYVAYSGDTKTDAREGMEILTEAEMRKLKFLDSYEIDPEKVNKTFRDELDRMIGAREPLPCPFASEDF